MSNVDTLDCPFCIPEIASPMTMGPASTDEFENGFHLTCSNQSCGFSLTARSKAILVSAYDTLWNYLPDAEAV